MSVLLSITNVLGTVTHNNKVLIDSTLSYHLSIIMKRLSSNIKTLNIVKPILLVFVFFILIYIYYLYFISLRC